MPPTMRSGFAPELLLPPPYTAVRLREWGDAFTQAVKFAPAHGAGTLAYVGRFDAAEFALVLEPEEPLGKARRVFYAGMAALADAIAATAPPETAIHLEWPDALFVNWGLVGGGCLAWPGGAKEDEIPEWLVFGGTIRIASAGDVEPGATPDVTALGEEGFADVTSNHIVESFARNFLQLADSWRESGFGAVAKSYFERLPRENRLLYDIDDNGDLLTRRAPSAKAERVALLPRLAQPSWLGAASEETRL